MLVLSRKAEQEIVIVDCHVKILSIQCGRVRIGIEAPADVPVHRLEVLEVELCGGSARGIGNSSRRP